MFATLMDRLGDRNPQLLRELKGRLNWRNVLIAVGLSLLAQLLILLVFTSQLPVPFNETHLTVKTVPELNYRFAAPPTRLFIEETYENGATAPGQLLPQAGDYITAIDGVPVASFNEDWGAVSRALDGISPDSQDTITRDAIANTRAKLQIERDEQTFEVQLERIQTPNYYNYYCKFAPSNATMSYNGRQSTCQLQAEGRYYQVDWLRWYGDSFSTLTIVMVVALLSAGSFLLIQNIDREQRRDTLTFVRLSPRSAFTILGGQILGVPIAVYLAIALCLPLQLGLGLLAGLNVLSLTTFYGFLLLNAGFFFSFALLYGLLSRWLGGFQAWLFGGAMLWFQSILGIMWLAGGWGSGNIGDWLILFSPVAALGQIPADPDFSMPWHIAAILFLLFVINSLIWSAWVWHGLRRKFINPKATLIHRPLSYLLTLCFEVFLLGFSFYYASSSASSVLATIACLNLLYFGLLIAAIQPTFQAMADWARFRHHQPKRQRSNRLQDWLFSDNSPPLVALALNLGIAFSAITVWITWLDGPQVSYLASLAACMTLILVYGAINQFIFVSRIRRPALWAILTLGMLVVVPLFMMLVLYEIRYIGTTSRIALLAAPWIIDIEGATLGARLFALLGQWTAIAVCTGIVTRRLKQVGASETKTMESGAAAILPNGT